MLLRALILDLSWLRFQLAVLERITIVLSYSSMPLFSLQAVTLLCVERRLATSQIALTPLLITIIPLLINVAEAINHSCIEYASQIGD